MSNKIFKLENMVVMLLVVSILSLRNYVFFGYFVQICFFLLLFGRIFRIKKGLIFTRGIFLLFSILSYFWAFNKNSYINVVPSLIQISLIMLYLNCYIDDISKINKLIDDFVISSVVLIINLIASTPLIEWRRIISYSSGSYVNVSSSAGRLGNTVGFHPNTFGSLLVILLLCVFYKLYKTKQKRYFILFLSLLVLLLLSKSRASIISFILGIFVFVVMRQKNSIKKNITIFSLIIAGFVLMWSFINIPTLYSIIGYRLEGIFNIFDTNATADVSTTTRIDFIKIGFDIFSKHPLFGIGLNNYSYVAYNEYNIWRQVYAHNNYIELLTDLGIIGFCLYYWVFIRSIKRIYCFYINYKKKEDNGIFDLICLMLSFSFIILLVDFSQVTYYNECFQLVEIIIISLGFFCYNLLERNEKNEIGNKRFKK